MTKQQELEQKFPYPKYEKYEPRPGNYVPEPGDETMYEYLLGCVGRLRADYGDYTAFINVDCKTPISRLLADVEKFAAYLHGNGFGKGDVITVFLPTCAHAYIVVYALSKLGIIADIVHPLTPPSELNAMLDHTKSKGVIILDRLVAPHAEVLGDRFTVVCSTADYTSGPISLLVKLDDKKNSNVPDNVNFHRWRDVMKNSYGRAPTVSGGGHETALYMHGGGTTGKSKTVQLSAFAMNSLAHALYLLDREHPYGKCCTLAVLPIFHAFGLGGILHYPMCNAYAALIMPKFDAKKANDYVKKYHVTEILGVPLMFKKMFAEENFDNPGLKNLLFCFSGGDFVSEEMVEQIDARIAKNGGTGYFSRGWGLTELSAVCAANNSSYYKKGSCGHAMQGLELAIFDGSGRRLPPGEVGEIAGRGATMMNGYLPDENVHDSGIWYDDEGRDWVLTGDMGYMDEEGYLFMSGRKKRIIVIAGYNVYPATVEGKIEEIPFIREVCAAQAYDAEGKPFMRLYVSLRDPAYGEEKAIAELTKFCEDNFEVHTRPREICVIDAMPRTKMEKIDFLKLTETPPTA